MRWAEPRGSQAHFLKAIDALPDPFVGVDLQGVVSAFNPGAGALFGLPASAVLGKPIAGSCLPESLRQCFAAALVRVRAGKPVAEEALEIEGRRTGAEAWIAEAKIFATGAGTDAMVAARLYDITGRREAEKKVLRFNRILRTMAGGNQALVRAASEGELFQAMCQVIVETGGYRMAWIGEALHDEEKTIRPVAHAGYEAGYLDLAKISWGDNPYGAGPTGKAVRTRRPQCNNDFATNPVVSCWKEAALDRRYRSSLSLPLRDKGGVFGALTIYSVESDAFGPEEMDLLIELAGDISYGVTALRTRRDHDEMEQRLRLIEERKQAEAALRESEERYRSLFEANPHPMWVFDTETLRFIEVNDAAVAHYGYTRDEFLRMTIEDIRPPGDAPQLRPAVATAAVRQSIPGEWQHCKKDGTVIEVEVTFHEMDFAGRKAMLVLAHDITARKQAEKALRENEERQSFLLALSDALRPLRAPREVMAAVASRLGKRLGVAYAGYAEVDAHGFVKTEGEYYAEVMPGFAGVSYSFEGFGKKTANLLRSGSPAIVEDILSADGFSEEERQAVAGIGVRSYVASPLIWGDRLLACLFAAHDVPRSWTDQDVNIVCDCAERTLASVRRARAEQALLESEERLAAAVRAGKLGVYDYDPRTGQINWDRTMYRLWGVPEGEPVTYETFEAGVHPQDLAATGAAVARALDPAGTHRYECEYRVISRADGSVRWIYADGDVTFDLDTPIRLVGVVQDITGKKRTEEELRQSEERYRGIYQHAGIGIAITDLEGRFQYCNPAFSGMLGYTQDELGRLNFPDLIHPEDREDNVAAGVRLRAQEIPSFEIVNRYLRKDGELVWVHKRVSLLRDADGTPTSHIALVADITERKQAEDQLFRSETLLRSATENAGVGLVLLDTNRRYLFANRAYSTILGLGNGDLVGKGPAEVLPEVYNHQISPRLDRAFAGERLTYELVTPEAGGQARYYTVVYEPLLDDQGRVTNVIVVIYDITAPKLAELRIAASEERFRGIYEHTATGISITDMEGRFQSCNPAYSAMLGYSEDELRALKFEELVHPEDREANMTEIERLIGQEIPSFEIVNRYIARGGKPIWVHKHVSLIRDAAGRPTNITALTTDMTERKRQEEQVTLLMHEVNHRAKNMLTVVLSVARQTLATQPEDFIGRFGERIQAMAASQDLLVKNEWKGVDLEELVRSQLAHFKDLIGARIELRGPPLFVSAPAAQTLGMALHELATNAGKYGALSNGEGHLQVGWSLESSGAGAGTFEISWRECGGPAVVSPASHGFGSTVITRLAKESLDAEVDLEYAAGGLSWRLQCPIAEVADGSRS
jgi:PAS domain S-box-containing protein